MLIVGLTGGIASGKSTVVSRLKEKHGLTIVDADLIAREVVEPGKVAYKQIVDSFLPIVSDLLNEDKSLNRAALGRAVFGNSERLKILNSIVHPAVKKEIAWQIFRAYIRFKNLVILDVPLLFETKLDIICGLTITITCPKDSQLQRLLNRNPDLTELEAKKRIDSQLTNDERNFRADVVIDNSKDLKQLYKSVDAVVNEINPNIIFTILDYFPPFAILSALFTFAIRNLRDKFTGKKPSSKFD
ncbi:dephospho-CoA kinase-domain-containing protein [Scheffersomyces amazonensis]|uniref:dephospho-CoA kinase-domain-containing protein n=1 Tax=Scheffersomyces amazonensis TaxID=1078765 RepID=UPI00315D9BDE